MSTNSSITSDLDVTLLTPVATSSSSSSVQVEMYSSSPRTGSPTTTTDYIPAASSKSPQDGGGDYTYDEILRGPPNGILRRWKNCKVPSETWERGHTLYMTLVGALIPTLVCFGVNFGVAVGIFRGNPPPTMWEFPMPLAGNYAGVIIVQTLINFPLVGALSTLDTLNGLCPSLSPAYLFSEMDTDTWLGWFLQPSELVYPPVQDKAKPCSRRILDTLKRIFVWILLQFILIWPLFTGITYRIWGNDNYNAYPQPQFIASTLGGTLALCTCPCWTLITMLNMGLRIDEERAEGMNMMRFDSTGGLGITASKRRPTSPVSVMI